MLPILPPQNSIERVDLTGLGFAVGVKATDVVFQFHHFFPLLVKLPEVIQGYNGHDGGEQRCDAKRRFHGRKKSSHDRGQK